MLECVVFVACRNRRTGRQDILLLNQTSPASPLGDVYLMTIEELAILEDALDYWLSSHRMSEQVEMFLRMIPNGFHLLPENDEFPPEAVEIAENLLLNIRSDLKIRELAGEIVSWWEGETVRFLAKI